MALFAVIYQYREGSDEARSASRPAHVEFLSRLHQSERLVVSGPTGDEQTAGALLVFRGESAEEVGALLDQDPFALAGLVSREMREWRPFFGADRLS